MTPAASNGAQLVDFRVLRNGDAIRTFSAKASELRALLTAAIRCSGGDTAEISDYELEVLCAGETVTTFVALAT